MTEHYARLTALLVPRLLDVGSVHCLASANQMARCPNTTILSNKDDTSVNSHTETDSRAHGAYASYTSLRGRDPRRDARRDARIDARRDARSALDQTIRQIHFRSTIKHNKCMASRTHEHAHLLATHGAPDPNQHHDRSSSSCSGSCLPRASYKYISE